MAFQCAGALDASGDGLQHRHRPLAAKDVLQSAVLAGRFGCRALLHVGSTTIVHLGADKLRVAEAERAGVTSVPALVLDGLAFHINFGAALSALR